MNADNERKKAWAERNPEKVKEAQNKANKKNWKKYRDNYDLKHPGKRIEIARKWYLKNYKPNPITDKTMQAKSCIAKGKLLEDFISKKMRESGIDDHARRTRGSGNGMEKGDIYNSLNLNIECKNQKKFSLNKFWDQTERDAEKTHTIPVLIWHKPNTSLDNCAVVIPLHYFLELSQHHKGELTIETNKDPELKWKIKRLVEAGKAVFKGLE